MRYIIRIFKIVSLLIWSLFVAMLTIPYQFMRGWDGTKKILSFNQLWCKGIARIINLRITISGDIPDTRGGLVVSNHMSYLDIITHGSVMPLRYSPKSDILGWPVLGWYVGLSRPVWISRESKQSSKRTMDEITQSIKHGIYMIIYPEGTTNDGKSGILPFKSTPFETVVKGDEPILPVLTRYKQPPGEPTVCWYGDMTLLPHVWQVLGLRVIEAELHFLPSIFPEGRSRKDLAAFAHQVMENKYKKN